MKRIALFAASVLFLTSSAFCKPAETGAIPGEWTMDFEAACKVAAEKKLPIFINFTGSDWCGWCKHMDKEVFSKQEWQDYAKSSLMLVWIDFPKDKSLVPEKYRDRNKQMAATFGVGGYPTYVILDDNGKDKLGKLSAAKQINPKIFIGKLGKVLTESEASMEKLIAGMPKNEGVAFKTACAERAATRKELNSLKEQVKEQDVKLAGLDKKIAKMRTTALIAKLTPAQAAKYNNAKEELAAAKKELKDWISSKPKKDKDSRKKYEEMSGKISDLDSKASGMLL